MYIVINTYVYIIVHLASTTELNVPLSANHFFAFFFIMNIYLQSIKLIVLSTSPSRTS